MNSIILLLVLAIALLSSPAFAAFNGTLAKSPDTVDELDISKYLGLWYQMYIDAIVFTTGPEKDAQCATALYGDNGDGTISVHNYAAIGAPNGPPYVINGYGYVPDSSEPGQLKVHFDSSDAFPLDAPYWVLALGPVVNGFYDYAIVSDNLSAFLFVIARDPETYATKYDAEVQQLLVNLGFTGLKKPIPTYQGSDCVYESTIRQQQIKNNALKAAAASK